MQQWLFFLLGMKLSPKGFVQNGTSWRGDILPFQGSIQDSLLGRRNGIHKQRICFLLPFLLGECIYHPGSVQSGGGPQLGGKSPLSPLCINPYFPSVPEYGRASRILSQRVLNRSHFHSPWGQPTYCHLHNSLQLSQRMNTLKN